VEGVAGTIGRPGPDLRRPLPSMAAEGTESAMRKAIDDVVERGQWAIWRLDADAVERMTPAGHARLLQWLGDHHMRIWCAPIRDIGTWQPPA
jgi:hypothetical protein